MSWRRWPWIEEGVLPLLIITLRLCWIWPWLLMLSRWLLPAALQPVLPLWNVALLLIGGAATTHALPVDRQRPRRARLLAAAIGLAAVALTLWLRLASDVYTLWDLRWLAAQGVLLTHWGGEFSPSFLVLILAASLWLRGMLDNPAPTHDDVCARLYPRLCRADAAANRRARRPYRAARLDGALARALLRRGHGRAGAGGAAPGAQHAPKGRAAAGQPLLAEHDPHGHADPARRGPAPRPADHAGRGGVAFRLDAHGRIVDRQHHRLRVLWHRLCAFPLPHAVDRLGPSTHGRAEADGVERWLAAAV